MAGPTTLAVRRRSRAPARPSPGRFVVIGLVALVAAGGLLLLLLAVAPPRPAPQPVPGELVAGDLTLQLQASGWITHDDVGGPTPGAVQNGFQMPASMMPGMPEHGTHRLYLEVVVSDLGSNGTSFAPGDFWVRSGNTTWPLNRPATFAPGTLQPGQARSFDLLFDVPEAVSRLDLVWNHDGQAQSLAVDSPPPPAHTHGGG